MPTYRFLALSLDPFLFLGCAVDRTDRRFSDADVKSLIIGTEDERFDELERYEDKAYRYTAGDMDHGDSILVS